MKDLNEREREYVKGVKVDEDGNKVYITPSINELKGDRELRHGKYDGSFMRGINTIWDIIVALICAIVVGTIVLSWFN